jgi:hypothetical protein
MATITLIAGVVLLGIGFCGHHFWTKTRRTYSADERFTRRWVMTIASVVVGLWLVAISAAHLLHYHVSGQW